ncbi:anti-anti-sigma factor [Geodermatophilus saharensis]|uniref:Anti-anti-sigma factor n=1 Tax=Geodermatophilus saharensis TaxID=1137994 RepID=A0A239DN80_9ACTN|nr:STAS domain-containing protein [Geodermatophilus saharensis]SNS33619.1 anti-anti-sigma factor [Geodermatophilus saharensis]
MQQTTTSLPPAEPAVAGLLVTLDLPAGRILLSGELDRATCGHLDAACALLARAAAPAWVLDLAGLSFCDASGLRAMAAVRRVARTAGAAVIVVGARPYLRRLLPLVGLGDALPPVARSVSGPVACHPGPAPAVRPAALGPTPAGPPCRGTGAPAKGTWDAAGRS